MTDIIHISELVAIILLATFASIRGRQAKESIEEYCLDGRDTIRYKLKGVVAWMAAVWYLSSYLIVLIDRYL